MPDEPTILDPEEFDREVDELFGHAKRQRKRKNAAIIVAGLALAIASVAAAVAISGESERDDLARKVQINGERLDQTNKTVQEQRQQFELCKRLPKTDPRCQVPVAPPTPTVTPEKPEQSVPAGVTEGQVRDIVAAEVARRNLSLTPSQITTIATVAAKMVPRPADGKTPTNAQLKPLVSVAVATFCANDACRGKDGADAPPVTQQQLTTTLVAYCEPRNDCIGSDGKQGPEGKQGPIGPAGRGIKSVTRNNETGVVTFTYTDDTQENITIKNGEDAFPFSFSFTIPGELPSDPGTTYNCVVKSSTESDCQKQ